jgi:hypothetical protein
LALAIGNVRCETCRRREFHLETFRVTLKCLLRSLGAQ